MFVIVLEIDFVIGFSNGEVKTMIYLEDKPAWKDDFGSLCFLGNLLSVSPMLSFRIMNIYISFGPSRSS